jgi:hypothetical protein
MKKLAFATAVAIIAAAAPATAATNLVKNGGFEATTSTTSANPVAGNFQIGTVGTVNDWTSTAGYNLVFNAATATTDNAAGNYEYTGLEKLWGATASRQGGKFVALDGDVNDRGAIVQTITGLTAGQQYVLSFDWGAGQLQSREGDTTEQLRYGLDGDLFTTEVLSNKSRGFTGWNTVTRTFTATGASQVLSFLSIGTPSGLPPIALLDNVSLTAAVPEPATWAMMLVGFGMIGASARYRRRNVRAVIA